MASFMKIGPPFSISECDGRVEHMFIIRLFLPNMGLQERLHIKFGCLRPKGFTRGRSMKLWTDDGSSGIRLSSLAEPLAQLS